MSSDVETSNVGTPEVTESIEQKMDIDNLHEDGTRTLTLTARAIAVVQNLRMRRILTWPKDLGRWKTE